MLASLLAGFCIGGWTVTTIVILYYKDQIEGINQFEKKTRQEIREEIEQLERDEYKIEIRPNRNIKENMVEHIQREIKRQHIGRGKDVGIKEIRIKERPDKEDNREDWVIYYEAETKTEEYDV